MDGVIDLKELKCSEKENRILEEVFKAFYNLVESPKIEKSYFLMKDDVERRFARPRIKESSVNFYFKDRILKLHEILNEPDGATEKATVEETGKEIIIFESYKDAEEFVVTQFKE